MSALLLVVKSGTGTNALLLDSGTAILLANGNGLSGDVTYVLTCSHNLKAARRIPNQTSEAVIFVNGIEASEIEDPELQKLDLAVLEVKGQLDLAGTLSTEAVVVPYQVRCSGFIAVFKHHFEHRDVSGSVTKVIPALTSEGKSVDYLQIEPIAGAERFEKGLSGAPIYDHLSRIVGIARILEEGRINDGAAALDKAYAIKFSPEIIALVQEKIPTAINVVSGRLPSSGSHLVMVDSIERPIAPPIANDKDPQKNRWGGFASSDGFLLTVQNVRMYSNYFTFDAVLLADSQLRIVSPIIFHLHDSYPKSIIWIRKTDGKKAILEGVSADGTYTLGVQFRNQANTWLNLEYDLEDYESGKLKKYDGGANL